jgi:hypothetical protein
MMISLRGLLACMAYLLVAVHASSVTFKGRNNSRASGTVFEISDFDARSAGGVDVQN